jgi:hypothetical protein
MLATAGESAVSTKRKQVSKVIAKAVVLDIAKFSLGGGL